jgi:hypothetical protein
LLNTLIGEVDLLLQNNRKEGPQYKRQAYSAWLLAKDIIGENREEFDSCIKANKETLEQTDALETMQAALKVIDKEVETEFEKQFLNIGGNDGKES